MTDKGTSWDTNRKTPNVKELDKQTRIFEARASKQPGAKPLIFLPDESAHNHETTHAQEDGLNIEKSPAQTWLIAVGELNSIRHEAGRKNNSEEYNLKLAEIKSKLIETSLDFFSGKISKTAFQRIENGLKSHGLSLLSEDGKYHETTGEKKM